MQINKLFFLFYILALLFIGNSCKQKPKHLDSNLIPEYNPEVAAFTSGLISNQSTIKIRLSSELSQETDLSLPIEENILSFEPKIEGSAYWIDKRTIEFRPLNPLPSGENFTAKLKLSELPGKKNTKDFSFSFSTIPLNLDINFTGIKAYSNTNLKWNRIEGTLRVSDVVNPSDLENILVAFQGNRNLAVEWDHESGVNHSFTIDSVERKEVPDVVKISWDGKPAGANIQGSREYPIPSLGEFTLMEHQIIQQPDQYISLLFSDPIKSNQDLTGLINLENNTSLRFTVDDNEIRIYPNVRQQGKLNLSIEPGILNILGYKFDESHTLSLAFEEMKPAVRLIGNGVIVPDAGELLFPFEAVNLKAVDVRVIKIFEENIAQFLQVNDLSGNNELKRAGRLILKKTVDLIPQRPINFNEWNAFSLDLTELVGRDPGAIYRVELSFRKDHSLYSCGENAEEKNIEKANDDFETVTEQEIAYWDASYGAYDYNYDYRYFNWSEKDDPCSESYYNYYNRKVARNIVASNIGIIAKAGRGRNMMFAVTDLLTTESLQGVKLDVYNFQNQLLASLTTNNEGVASIELQNEPYLVIASKNDQKAYLRVDRGSSLSLSQFDISGTQTQKGIKGFIYGERGVWRPGDSIFITFILEDKENKIPDDHPVLFELTDPRGKLKKKISMNQGTGGFYPFHASTLADDPTGMWNLKVEVGGATFYKSLRVETVKPNRLKIELDAGSDMLYSGSSKPELKLTARWLHGAKAANLKANVNVNFRNRPTNFSSFKDYQFTDITKSISFNEKQIFEGKLDSEGEAIIRPDFDLRGRAPGFMTAVLTTRVFERGGDFSIDRIPIPYSPYPVYCGLKFPEGDQYGMLQTDSLQRFEVITVNEKGSPVSQKNLEVKVYKLNWSWWWHSSSENLASYVGNPSHQPVYTTKISTNDSGKASFRFKIDYPEWGRFLVLVTDPSGGHSCSNTVYFDWPGWAGRASRKDPGTASILPFSSDKSSYNT
ncbi:MAG: MG2 domain-containing protein, partial [Bacteroidales bacterium]